MSNSELQPAPKLDDINDRLPPHMGVACMGAIPHAGERRLQNLANQLPSVLYQLCLRVDGRYSVPYISSSCYEVYELSPDTIKSDPASLYSLIHPGDRQKLKRSMRASAADLSAWQLEYRLVTPSGQEKWLQMAARPQRLPSGNLLFSGVMMDITDRKQAEAKLQASEARLRSQTKQLQTALQELQQAQVKLIQSEKMSSLGQLVAGIAHEINNPVSFIHGNITHIKEYSQDMLKLIRLYQAHHPTPHPTIQALTDDLDLNYVVKDLPKLLDSMRLGTNRIRNIVLSLRNFSRLDESALKQTDIHEGLENTLMILSSRLESTALRPAIKVIKAYERLPAIECYAGQLNQVFMNILGNAIDAIDEAVEAEAASTQSLERAAASPINRQTVGSEVEPKIVLQTFQKSDRLVIQITNSGPSIPAHISQRMFDPFFTTKAVGKGIGMGLAICYQTIVDLHKGILEHRPTADGRPTFVIEIPIILDSSRES